MLPFMLPFARERMDAALAHLEQLFPSTPPTSATAIAVFLQECLEEDLATIHEKPWVRDRFHITDIDGANWASHYGTTTLVDRRLDFAECFRVHCEQTKFGRDALCAGVRMEELP